MMRITKEFWADETVSGICFSISQTKFFCLSFDPKLTLITQQKDPFEKTSQDFIKEEQRFKTANAI